MTIEDIFQAEGTEMPNSRVDVSEALQKLRDSGEYADKEVSQQTDWFSSMRDKVIEFLSDLKKEFLDWLQELVPAVELHGTGYGDLVINIIIWVLVILFVIILIFILLKLLEHYRKTEKEEFTAILNIETGKLDSSSWIDLARNCASKGAYRDACRAVYMSIIFYLDEKELIKYDNAKTNMEYLQLVRSKAELYTPLKEIVNIFEFVWYGEQPGSKEEYDTCIEYYDRVVNE